MMALVILVSQAILVHFLPEMAPKSGCILLFFVIFLPIEATMTAWLSLWKFLEVESLRPIRRSAFLGEMAMAMGLTALRALATYMAMFFAWWLLEPPGVFTPFTVTRFLIAAVAANLGFFAVGVWLLRFHSRRWMTFGFLPVYAIAAVPFLGLILNWPGLIVSAGFGALLLAGAWVFYDAIRRWQFAELG
jgi:hypothetical protein